MNGNGGFCCIFLGLAHAVFDTPAPTLVPTNRAREPHTQGKFYFPGKEMLFPAFYKEGFRKTKQDNR